MHRSMPPAIKRVGTLLPLAIPPRSSDSEEANLKRWLMISVAAVFAAWIPLMLLVSSFWLGWPNWMVD